ncbi:Endonuclease/exonuclease/phosphatase [Crepidotus variabilis]|uniref:Endonuclease/exonuclease/phosphatase n=1 Tax=Crepidotus variabilis TaxID=179855 RepID=A0A9P6EEP1_9AGAR|nr:Endonuclease/exonuclease/phosphatase [Crepidotus variabilis]
MAWYSGEACGQKTVGWSSSSLQAVYQGLETAIMQVYSFLFVTSVISAASSTLITEIQGIAYQSSFAGKKVSNVTGVVTVKSTSGFYLQGNKTPDIRASNGLLVYTTSTSILGSVNIGDLVSLGGTVSEFRSLSNPDYLYQTELASPTNITVLSHNNTVAPLVIGRDRSPPTQKLNGLDIGTDGFLTVPNNQSLTSTSNRTLEPLLYGMDFWESLEGQLVTIPKPVALDFQNTYGEFWVHGDWPVTGKNGRGGLSLTFGPDGVPDGNPEAVIVGTPFDKTKNPKPAVGATLTDITGVVTYQFGFFYVIPLTAPTILSLPDPTIPPTNIISDSSDNCSLIFGDYNVENMAPTSSHIPAVASHIGNLLRIPDLMFIQEIQDNSGPTDDGTVNANITLSALINAIAKVTNITYSWASIDPVDGQDGGQPGGNIRPAFLYRKDKLTLVSGSPVGGSLDVTDVVGEGYKAGISFNPGRVDPLNPAWNSTRKPLVAHWQTSGGGDLFTINVHLSSKGGSTTTQGDARPPVNSPVEARTAQVNSVANFVQQILNKDPNANVVVAGDFNEYIQTRSVYKALTSLLTDIDEVAGIPEVERYSYVYDQNSQQLDHALVSSALKYRGAQFEHIHVNNWAPTLSARISDHDPSVGRIYLC